MTPVRKWRLTTIAVALLAYPAFAQDPDQSLRIYAVEVVRVPVEGWIGHGVYLGNGLVLTAAHVIGSFLHTNEIKIAGQKLSPNILKLGQFSDVDLALVSVDQTQLPVSLRLRRMTICDRAPFPGEQVIVATPDAIAASHVVSPNILPANLAAKFKTAIADVATTGNSGSGVFDANRQCLMGIISAKIQQSETRLDNGQPVKKTRDVAKYFVPAPVISQFIPAEYHY
jgi:Trypsin-like peptidase domain